MPIGLSHWRSSVVSPGSSSYFAMAIEVYAQDGKRGLRGGAYAPSEMAGGAESSREFNVPAADVSPGMVGLGACGSLFTQPRNWEVVTEKSLARYFLSIEAARSETLSHAY